jgi:hypothetical protein
MLKTATHFAIAALFASGALHSATTLPQSDGGATTQATTAWTSPISEDVTMLYGHPTIPAGTAGLPTVDTGKVPAASLPADTLTELAGALNGQPGEQQYVVHPERIVSLELCSSEDMASGDAYTIAQVEAKDDDGVTWGWTLTVAP